MVGGGDNGRNLDQTPTWAVAGVCAVMILISFALEKGLHKIGMWLTKKHKTALYEALDRIKGELMVMGFISLLLTFSQSFIEKIHVNSHLANTMLPCRKDTIPDNTQRRSLIWNYHRILLSDNRNGTQEHEKAQPLISSGGLHQLHILIFFLAVLHVLYSAITMLLGRLKIRGWKEWEHETTITDYELTNDPSRFNFRLTHETSFVKAHSTFWTNIKFFFYVGCFFRQFFRSVTKTDYLTLRNGFIAAHLAPGTKFNFRRYIKRSLEDDFKVVVGVSPLLWASFVIFLLLNVDGWSTLFWAAILPPIIILAVGTKLQAILAKMALEIKDRHAVILGVPLVQGSDRYFWFSKPQFLLHLLHFSLFQSAFQIAYLLWILCYDMHDCFHGIKWFIMAKIVFGIGALVLCSYSTLPLYALVTQMGSHMKKSIFDEQTSKALKRWHMAVKAKKEETSKKPLPPRTLGETSKRLSNSFNGHSSGPPLHRFMTTGHSVFPSAYDGHDEFDYEHDERSLLYNNVVTADNDDGKSELRTMHSGEEVRE